MKKTFTLFALLLTGLLTAQTPSLQAWTTDAAGTTTLIALPNGTVVSYTTSASTPTAMSTKTVKVRFMNTSATSHTYSVERIDVYVNPASPGASPYFCFGDLGTCYSTFATEPNAGDYSVLGPGDYTVPGKQLITDLDEAYTVGYSEIRYKLFEVNTGKMGADTLSWTMKYNQGVGINEHSNILENVSNIYPNPTSNNASVTVILTDEVPVKVQVYNSLGSLVYNGAEQPMNGKNKVNIDCTNFNSGLYFVTVTAGHAKITKRLIVNK